MTSSLNADALATLFQDARTPPAFTDTPVPLDLLKQAYELAKLGPTSVNSCPARFVFLAGAEAKARLKPHLAPLNVEKTLAAPWTMIVAHDLRFFEKFEILFPMAAQYARAEFENNSELAATTALRNGSLQGAYFIMAARALGLDCGPMSGFSNEGVDQEFFPDGRWKSNFLCNIGYGAPPAYPRRARLDFDVACQVLG